MAEGIQIGAAFIEIHAEIRDAEGDLNHLKKKFDGSSVTINANADTGLAGKQIAFAARRRTVDLDLKVNGLAAVGKALAAMSGGAAVGKMLGNIGEGLGKIPANIPKIAATSVAIGTIGAASMASLGGVISLAGGLASVAGAGLALPGMMAGFAVGAGVMIAALKDAPTVLADLGPAFSGLQDSISSNFWGQAAAPIRELTTSLLPSLTTSLNGVATEMGGFFGQFANQLKTSLGSGVLEGMMGNLSSSINIMRGAIQPVVESFTTLGSVGSQYLPQLATWIVGISEKFNTFIQSAAADGSLKGWIDGGIAGLKTLGSIVGSVVSIFGGLIQAANAAGGSGLTGLSDGLAKIAAIVNGPAFQGALTTVFQGAAAGMQGLSTALRPIGDMFVALAPTISNVMTLAGQLGGQVLTALAGALSQPAFATGLTNFFAGVQMGLQAVLPHLPMLGNLFGQLMSVVGQLAAVVGPVLGAALGALGPAFSTILTAIQPLIPILGGALISIITALSPLITMVANAFAQLMPVIAMLIPPITTLITALIPPLMTVFQALMPIIMQVLMAFTPLVEMLTAFLIPAIQLLMPVVTTVFSAISGIISGVMQVILGIITTVTGLISGNWDQVWNGIQTILAGVWNTIVATIQGAIDVVSSVVGAGINFVSSIINSIFSGIASFVSSIWNSIVEFISSAITRAGSFVSSGVSSIGNFINSGFNSAVSFVTTAFNNIANAVSTGINNAVNFVSGLPSKILGALGDLGSLLYNSGASLLEGLKNGIMGAVGSVTSAVSGALGAIRNLFPFSPAKEGPFSGHGYTTYSGKALAGDFAKGILSQENAIEKATSGLLGMASSNLSTGLNLDAQANIASSGIAGSRGIINNNTSSSNIVIENITIDAKNVREFNDVVELINSIKQTARTGSGIQNARIA